MNSEIIHSGPALLALTAGARERAGRRVLELLANAVDMTPARPPSPVLGDGSPVSGFATRCSPRSPPDAISGPQAAHLRDRDTAR